MADSTIDKLYEAARSASPAVADVGPPVLRKVAPGIRVLALRTPTLPPAAHTNVYLVGPDEGPWAAVDPGSPYPDQEDVLDTAIETAGVKLGVVLLTHHHGDHTGGAARLAKRWGAPIAAHANTQRRLPTLVTQTLEDGERIADMECVFTPGHADGHLCFAHASGTIAGDMVAGLGTILIDPSEGDMAEYLRSLEKLLARPPMMLLPAHGPELPDGHAKLREYIAHRLMREAKVAAALQSAPEPTSDLVARAYSDTPRMLWPLAERSLIAHLVKLASDGRARESSPGRWSAT